MDIGTHLIVLYVLGYIVFGLSIIFAIELIFQPKWPFMKKYIGCFYGDEDRFIPDFLNITGYDLVGIWGFSDYDVKIKIKILKHFGIEYSGYMVPMREVRKFPKYCVERF